ncbi:MAG: AsmA family protein [Terriglobales bacterium]
MSWFRSRRGLVALLGALLLVLFVMHPTVGGLRTKIAHSISISLGRRVEISSASLRFLPQPGFDLEHFIVYDDPAFSAEPLVSADEVTASLRITSLLRGHLEISTLSLSEPSLNLVRSNNGHWNLEYLLDRAARVSVAPTGKAATETRPGFPYIEANGGRINFKFGMEKKQFALTDADFALFQDSENSWGMRLEAKPVRTDSNFSDTGLLKISGSWQRAQSLHKTPLRFSMLWERAQLGQASKLIYGNDKGWRGALALSMDIRGTPENLAVLTQASVEDFRRYDILTGDPMRLRVQCGGNYSSTSQLLSNIICESPVGDGAVSLHGNLSVSTPPAYHFSLFAQDVPLQSLITLASHSKKDIPNDLLAAGTLDGAIKIRREVAADAPTTSWEGSAETSEFRLASQLASSQLSLPQIHFTISSSGPNVDDQKKVRHTNQKAVRRSVAFGSTRVDVSPFPVELGDPLPATVSGWFSRSGYSLMIDGNAQLQQLLRASRTIGIAAPHPDAEGKVKLGLQITDTWAGFKAPKVTGNAELRSVRAEVRGLNAPIEINDAKMLLEPDKVNVQSLTAQAAGTTWHGSLVLPRPCGLMGTCPVQMDLHADEIGSDKLAKLLDPQYAKRPWYRFLLTSPKNSYLLALRATGQLTADRILLHKLSGARFSTTFDLNRGKLQLTNLRVVFLGGTETGNWTMDFTVRPPAYSGEGSFQNVSLAQLSSTARDNWISGTAAGTYHATASGRNADELFSSATGILQIQARDGFMPHLVSTSFAGPLQIRHFEGDLVLRHKEIDFGEAKLEANGGTYQVTGTASLGRALNLKLVRSGSRALNITGTVSAPVISISPVSQTEAALKP